MAALKGERVSLSVGAPTSAPVSTSASVSAREEKPSGAAGSAEGRRNTDKTAATAASTEVRQRYC